MLSAYRFGPACGPLLLLLAAAAPVLAQTPAYRCVVADARTRAALPAATVQADGQTLRTDEAGRFGLPARPAQLQLTHLGYQPRRWQPAPAADTLWLTPQAVALPGVSVHSAANVLRLVPAGELRKSAPSSTPNWFASAVWHRPPAPGGTYRLRAVEVLLAKRPLCSPDEVVQDQQAFREGRVRVRLLVPAADGSFALTDSLTSAFIITPARSRNNRRGVVRLELAERRLLLPATGVVVLLDILPTFPNEQMADDRTTPEGNRVDLRCHLPDGSSRLRRTTICDYPALAEFMNLDPARCISVLLPKTKPANGRLSAAGGRRTPNNLGVTLELQQL